MVTGEVLVAFECVEDDRTQRGPAGKRRRATAERVGADCNMGEVAADLWPGFVDHAEVAVQEDARFP